MKLYEDLDDLPIFNWFKIHDTGDLTYLLLVKKKVKPSEQKKLETKWMELYEMYIKEFGFSEQFLSILKKEKEIALLMIEKAETGNNVLQTFIELKQYELKAKTQDVTKANLYETKAHMEKSLGFQLNIKQMSVMEFYSNIKTIESESKRK